jgi:hypothetical protein
MRARRKVSLNGSERTRTRETRLDSESFIKTYRACEIIQKQNFASSLFICTGSSCTAAGCYIHKASETFQFDYLGRWMGGGGEGSLGSQCRPYTHTHTTTAATKEERGKMQTR